ncbi:hypothetical protein NDU88_006056 [Pleurodeles waltl]|uniref:Uncharacterized protein n=1 Tax=Pleurodeles waltl TaxID=8319 RepID=A0AAV7PK05_PLEWA|nr:hypothetical protein NDU88_006056 [Pleurodeles waltl]
MNRLLSIPKLHVLQSLSANMRVVHLTSGRSIARWGWRRRAQYDRLPLGQGWFRCARACHVGCVVLLGWRVGLGRKLDDSTLYRHE